MSNENASDWYQRIQAWLTEEELPVGDITNFKHDYEFLITVTPAQIAIIKPKERNKILIAFQVTLPPHDQQTYAQLDDSIKNNFIVNLTKDSLLIGLFPNFQPSTPTVSLTSVEFTSTIYMDNFSKSKLFEEIDRMKRSYAVLMLNLEKFIPKFKPMDDSKLV